MDGYADKSDGSGCTHSAVPSGFDVQWRNQALRVGIAYLISARQDGNEGQESGLLDEARSRPWPASALLRKDMQATQDGKASVPHLPAAP